MILLVKGNHAAWNTCWVMSLSSFAGRPIRQSSLQRWSTLLLGGVLVLFVGGRWLWPWVVSRVSAPAEVSQGPGEAAVDDPWLTLQRLGQEIPSSVVRIQSDDDEDTTLGFGVIVDSRAYVLTSYTLVRGRASVPLRLHTPPSYRDPGVVQAHFVAGDEFADIAVLEFVPPDPDLIRVRQIARRPPMLGQPVLSLPDVDDPQTGLQLGQVLRRGSAGARSALHELDLIGTNVATGGNIGSPLMTTEGEILGICIAEHASHDPRQGHVVPALAADSMLADLMRFGRVRRGWIGMFAHAAWRKHESQTQSLVAHVDYVVPGSPAERGGLKTGDDILLASQHVPARSVPELQRLILATLPPQSLALSVLRRNSFEVLSVGVEDQPLLPPALPGEREWGVHLSCPQEPLEPDPDLPHGVQVRLVQSGPLAEKLKAGDLIVNINGMPTPGLEGYCVQAAAVLSSRVPVHLQVWRVATSEFHEIELASTRDAGGAALVAQPPADPE